MERINERSNKMKIETVLHEEIHNEFGELKKLEVGSEGYRTAVDGICKLLDRAIYCFWGVSLCIIWALIAFFGKSEYAAKVSYNNAALAVCGVLLAAVLYFVISRVRFTVKFRAIAVIGFLFCLFQDRLLLYLLYKYF